MGPQDPKVGDHRARSGAGRTVRAARARTSEVTARSAKLQPRHEAARALFHDDQYLARVRHDLRRTAAAGQAHRGVRIVADHGAVEVAEAIDLRCAQEADIDAAALQVMGKNLRKRYHAGSRFRKLPVA